MNISIGSIHETDSLFLNMFIATLPRQTRLSLSHSHPFAEVSLVLSGTGTYTASGQEYAIAPGDLFFFGSDTIHYITNATSTLELLTLQFPVSMLVSTSPFRVSSPDWRLFASPVAMHIASADTAPFQNIMREIQVNLTKKALGYTAYTYSLVVMLAISLMRLAADRKIVLKPMQNNAAILAALTYIDNNFTQRITLQDVSAAAMLSPSYFSSSFKQYTGYSLIDYTNAKRIRLASKLLLAKQNASISEIAMQVGFNNMSNFNRAFRKYAGCTPSEYISKSNRQEE